MASLLEERKAQDKKINRNRVKSSVKANNDPTYNYLVHLNRFRDLGKQIGKTAKELVDSVDEKENKKDINKEEAIDVEFEEKK